MSISCWGGQPRMLQPTGTSIDTETSIDRRLHPAKEDSHACEDSHVVEQNDPPMPLELLQRNAS